MRPFLLLTLLLPLPLLAAERAAPEKPVLAILDFECPEGSDLGDKVANRLQRRALEANTHTLMDRDDIKLAVRQADLKIKHTGTEKQLQDFARDQLGANLVLWGKAEPRDGGFHVAVRCMETAGAPKPYLDVEKDCANFAALANFYTDFEPVLLKKRAALRTLTPVDDAAKKKNLVKNFSFEAGTWTPDGWSKIDGLILHWLDRDDGKGKCIMMDTDVEEKQALDWMARIEKGEVTAKDAPKKIASNPNTIYGTIGAWEGVQFYSDFIPVKPKVRYRITVDIKARWGGIFFPKAFVKGYADMQDAFTDQKRELYRAYLALRTETQGKQWETFSRTFNPTLRDPKQRDPNVKIPDVKFIRVMLYAYWPLGKYYWDNVVITEEAIED